MYEEDEPSLSTLPPSHATPARAQNGSSRPAQQVEGNLLGEEFASPLSTVKKGD